MRVAFLVSCLLTASSCERDAAVDASDGLAGDAIADAWVDALEVDGDAATGDAEVLADAPDGADAAADAGTDAGVDGAGDADAGVDGDVDADEDGATGDALEDLGDTATELDADDAVDDVASCAEGAACQPQTYVPPCYEGRCNARGTCMLVPTEGCCRSDTDCAPDVAATACQESRCVVGRCQLATFPGCCADDPTRCLAGACDLASGRCRDCPESACPDALPLFEARFDDGVWPLSVSDFQYNDQVSWNLDARRFAAGGGAAYLGNPRCRTYYGGALDAACRPITAAEQDSARVEVQARTPWIELPADGGAVASLWVWAEVEPALGRGAAEPDVLRVWVEPGDGGPAWLVASTLDIGKSTGGAWRPLLVDLGAWRGGYVRLMLDFDTFDGENNRFEGVWIDDLVVSRACADGGCCASDGACADRTACDVGRCVQAAQGTGGVCITGPPEPGLACTTCSGDDACGDDDPCTDDRCQAGACSHDAFCCIEHDVLDIDVARDGLQALYVQDDNPVDGVEWQADQGAAWFGDPTTGTYASRPPPRAVAGALWTTTFTLPAGDRPLALDLDLSLSTEWDLGDPVDPGEVGAFTNPAGLDRLSVELIDGQYTTELWNSDALGGSTHGAVVPVRIDLGPWRGRAVALHIRFDSGDADANDFGGPRIRRIAAGSRCD